MVTIHAALFFLLGLGMLSVPELAPASFPPGPIGGANVSAVWLQVMGWLNALIGAGYLARLEVIPLVQHWNSRLLEFDRGELLATTILRPVNSFESLLRVRGPSDWPGISHEWNFWTAAINDVRFDAARPWS